MDYAEQPVAAKAAKRCSYRSLSAVRGPAERQRYAAEHLLRYKLA